MRRRLFRVCGVLGLPVTLATCVSMPADRAAEEAIMWEAARECQARFSSIDRIDGIDQYGRLHFTYAGSAADNAAFIACYGERLGARLRTAGLPGKGRLSAATLASGRTSVAVTVTGNATFVPVTLNETQTATLLLDTGATNTILGPALAQRLDLVPPLNARKMIMGIAGGSTLTVPFTLLRSLKVGPFVIEDLSVGVYDVVPYRRDTDGILGNDVLRHFRASLDQRARLLTLEVVPTAAPAATPRPGSLVAEAKPRAGTVAAPVWKVGDEWSYRWESPRGSGTYVSSVSREDAVDGIDCYVLRSGRRESYYRKTDFAFVLDKVGDRVERRVKPPLRHFVWPLAPGATWEETYTDERPEDRQTHTRSLTTTVEADEAISVPAGTFRTLKIVQRYTSAASNSYEAWYAPEAKRWVRLREHLSYGIRTRELTAYTAK